MLLVLQSVDVVDTFDVQWIQIGVVRTRDGAAGLATAEYHLVTFCVNKNTRWPINTAPLRPAYMCNKINAAM